MTETCHETLHVNLKAIAARLGVSTDVVRRWIRRHGLPAFHEDWRDNAPWMCLESSLSAWLRDFERQCGGRAEPPQKKGCQQ